MSLLLKFLFSGAATLILFIGALGGQILAGRAARSGQLRKARIAGWVAFVSSSLLALVTILSVAMSGNMVSLFFAGLWIWIAWRDYKFLNALPS